MSWLKGVKNSADTSKYKGYKVGGGIKPETTTSDPTSTKVAGPTSVPGPSLGKSAKPIFGKSGKKAFKTGGRVHGKANGGAETDNSSPNPGEISDAAQEKYLRDKSSAKFKAGLGDIAKGAGSAILGHAVRSMSSGAKGLEKGISKGIEYGNYGSGVAGIGVGAGELAESFAAHKDADKFKGRKEGGRVSKEGGGGCGGAGGATSRLKRSGMMASQKKILGE